MNKLLLVIPLIALLTYGSISLLNKAPLSASLPVDNITFSQLRACQGNVPLAQCNTIDDDAAFDTCQKASYDFGQLASSGNTIPACASYNQYFSTAAAQQKINQNGYYYNCFTSVALLKAVRNSDFYYRYTYAPKYLDCAQISI